ncbi:MAG TPA: hypothetical protein VGE12_05270 [Noviherbaspirillum sp.]
MRLLLTALFMMASGLHNVHAATQQQCETLAKPVEAKIASLPDMDEIKPTKRDCTRAAEAIKMYAGYQAQADRLNCPFAYLNGQTIGGAAERADLLADMKQAYSEKCR